MIFEFKDYDESQLYIKSHLLKHHFLEITIVLSRLDLGKVLIYIHEES